MLLPLSISHLLLVASFVQARKLNVIFEWNEIDFKYETADERWSAIESHSFQPNNVSPFGIEIYRERLFVTLPRWRNGVPATLAYLQLNANGTKSPALMPFPSWEAHNLQEEEPELVSPFRIRADRCGRLWVLDSRIAAVLESRKLFGPPQLLVYDLHNDNLLRRHVFPISQTKEDSFFANIAIEDNDCDNTFAYAADLGSPGLVVYSWAAQESWRMTHHFFHPDPMAGNFSIDGLDFQWDDGLYGLALSPPHADGSATLYFHPLSSLLEFAVNTSILRNRTLATSGQIYNKFQILGARGVNQQAGASFFDKSSQVLFYALPNHNAVGCWQSQDQSYNGDSQGIVYESEKDLIFPTDVTIDAEQRLWVLSNRLQDFIYEELNPQQVNFRILSGPVANVIQDTPCEAKVVTTVPTTTTSSSTTPRTGTTASSFTTSAPKMRQNSGSNTVSKGAIKDLSTSAILSVLFAVLPVLPRRL